jgi:beta-lactam-binding protein with PASTA domain
LPQTAVVPDVVGDKSAFAAEEKLTAADLKLDPNQKTQVDDKQPPGTVLKQTPAAGEEVEKGTPVAILVAVGSGNVNVPDITKKTASDADSALREKQLTLGQASPTGADPEALIETQIPAPGEVVKQGTPVNIFYPDPTAEDKKSDAEKEKDKKEGKGKGGAAPGGAGAGAADITVPPIAKQSKEEYAKAAADLGIVPEVVKRFNNAPPNTLFATIPEPGTKVKKGAKVRLLVSVGQPEVVYTNEKDIKRVDGRNGAPLEPVAEGPQEEEDPAYNAAGTHVAYVAEGRVLLKDLTKKDSKAIPITPAGRTFGNLAWAPTADSNVIAMNSENDDGSRDMCLANVTDETVIDCIATPDLLPDRAIHWNPNGREIIAHAVKAPIDLTNPTFGLARWRLKKDKPAFSSTASDWGKGKFVSDVETPGKGVLDAAISPDGKSLAIISNQGSSFFRLWLAEPDDYLLTSAKPTDVRACKVAWRGDSQELIVVRADAGCGEQTGSLERLSPNNTKDQRRVAANGDDPVYQPFILGG